MWLIGVLSLMILVGVLVGFISRSRTSPTLAADWDLESLSGAYAAIVAPLAGFSVAAAVFFANLTRVTQTVFFDDVMALFLVAFVMLISTAVMFATFRSARLRSSADENQQSIHRSLYMVCNLGFYLSLSMSWIGLHPLLLAVGLSTLADIFTWVLLFALLAGAIRVSVWAHVLLGVGFPAFLSIPIVPMLAAIVYGLTVRSRLAFWPTTNPALLLAVLVFAVAAVGYGFETAMIIFYGRPEYHRRLRRIASMLIIPYLSAGITIIALLWFATAFA
ncbi:MAG: hypothetical protein ACRDGM_09095 [bacterium]